MDITGKTPTEAPSGMHTYVCPECGKTVYCATDDAELICDSCRYRDAVDRREREE